MAISTVSKQIGPSFSDEIFAANLNGLSISWSDSFVQYENLTSQQQADLLAVVAAHDHTIPASPPEVPSFEKIRVKNQDGEIYIISADNDGKLYVNP